MHFKESDRLDYTASSGPSTPSKRKKTDSSQGHGHGHGHGHGQGGGHGKKYLSCFDWNSEKGCDRGSRCRYPHRCGECGSTAHKEYKCKKADGKESTPPPAKK